MEQTSSTISVLLVEEDSYYGWQIGRFLQGIQDCSATTVTTLGEATEKFASHHPDVLLLAEGSSAEKSFEWFCAIHPESNHVCILISLKSDDTSSKGAYLQKGA